MLDNVSFTRLVIVLEEKIASNTLCIICSLEKPSGIRICNEFICSDCERDIVATDVGDERYKLYVESMKRIWLSATS